MIGIFAGAFGGATIAEQLAARLERVPGFEEYAEPLALVVVVIAITFVSLVVGELVPKRVAMQWPERIAIAAARPLNAVAKLLSPLVKVLTASTKLVLRIVGVKRTTEPVVTEDEIHTIIRQGAEAGVLDPAEQRLVKGVFRLGDATVEKVMTPRTELHWIDLDDDERAIKALMARLGQPHYLVCHGSVENVQGIVRAEDVLSRLLADQPFDFAPILKSPLYIPATMTALDLLEQFRQAQEQAAVVLDEFGGLSGLVTRDDLVEEILGGLHPFTGDGPPITRRDDGTWLVDGSFAIEDLVEVVEQPIVVGDDYRTVGGLVMMHLGRVPGVGERLELGGLRFEVVDMDGRRVDKVLVSRVSASSAGPGS